VSALATGGRIGGRSLPGVLLSLLAVLPTMGAVLIVPILPSLAKHFSSVAGIALIATVILTLPALCIGLFSPIAGAAADRFGRRKLLLFALGMYAFAGAAPAFLDSVPLIIVSRIVVGIMEAAIMTCCTTLLGDYYAGVERARWLSYQSAVTATGATLLFIAGGMLGTFGWRAPFLLYGLALPVAALAARYLPEPAPVHSEIERERFSWAPYRLYILLAAAGAIGFYAIPVQLGFILGGISVNSPLTIGLVAALANVAVAAGAISFRFLRLRGSTLLVAAAFVAGCGFIGVALSTTLPLLLASAMVNGLGTGLLLPTMLNMTMANLPFEMRGRGTGIYMGAFFIGQFLSPIVVTLVAKASGSLTNAIASFGIASLVAALAGAAAMYLRPPRPHASDSVNGPAH
jgi:MFS family permease